MKLYVGGTRQNLRQNGHYYSWQNKETIHINNPLFSMSLTSTVDNTNVSHWALKLCDHTVYCSTSNE